MNESDCKHVYRLAETQHVSVAENEDCYPPAHGGEGVVVWQCIHCGFERRQVITNADSAAWVLFDELLDDDGLADVRSRVLVQDYRRLMHSAGIE